ncbi:unnamed protein product [Urochloa humidicola]
MQNYYRYGEFDNCFGKWGDLVDCLTLKTKPVAEVEEILIAREKAKPHIWTFRTVDEASEHWWRMYKHLVMFSAPMPGKADHPLHTSVIHFPVAIIMSAGSERPYAFATPSAVLGGFLPRVRVRPHRRRHGQRRYKLVLRGANQEQEAAVPARRRRHQARSP